MQCSSLLMPLHLSYQYYRLLTLCLTCTDLGLVCSLEDPKIQEQTNNKYIYFSEISQGEADNVHYSLKVSEWVYFEKTNLQKLEKEEIQFVCEIYGTYPKMFCDHLLSQTYSVY